MKFVGKFENGECFTVQHWMKYIKSRASGNGQQNEIQSRSFESQVPICPNIPTSTTTQPLPQFDVMKQKCNERPKPE